MWPQHPAVAALTGVRRPPRPVVLGVVAVCAGLSAHQLARLVGYDEVQTVGAAALKLEPADPLTATGWTVQAGPLVEAMAEAVAGCTTVDDIPAAGAPLIEQWAQDHATTTQRLFRA
jgi:urease accessory protein